MMTTNKQSRKATKQEYVIDLGGGKEKTISALSASQAVAIHTKRGNAGLGRGWTLTRQPNGWIVATNSDRRTLDRPYVRLKEVNWSRKGSQRVD